MTYVPNENRYREMTYNRVGQSGLKLPAVSLGLWHSFGEGATLESARALIKTAFDAGITHFDLANNYGPPEGAAEQTFGKILKTDLCGHRDELVISTKAGYFMWDGPYGDGGSRKYLLSSLDQSLKRMGLDYVDVFYSHRFDPNTPLEETMGALDTAVKSGRALYAGISNYNAEQTAKAIEILNSLGTPLLIHQMRYSMFERTPEEGLLKLLSQKGVGAIAFSPLAKGLLTDRYLDGIPADSRAAGPSRFLQEKDITEDRLTKVRALSEIALARGQTMAQLALAWVLRRGLTTSVLIGASKPQQILDNVQSLKNAAFTDDELSQIDKILAQ